MAILSKILKVQVPQMRVNINGVLRHGLIPSCDNQLGLKGESCSFCLGTFCVSTWLLGGSGDVEGNSKTDKGTTALLPSESLRTVLTCMFKITLWGRSGQAGEEQGKQETKIDLIDAEGSLFPYFPSLLPRLQVRICI